MQEPTFNQFAAPQAVVADMAPHLHAEGVGELRLFSAKGRIGRIRYLAYGSGAWLLSSASGEAVKFVTGGEVLGSIAAFALVIVWFWFATLTCIKRLHDFDVSGWWSALPLASPVVIGLAVGMAGAAHSPNLATVLIGALVVIELGFSLVSLFRPGSKGVNRYGAPPPPNKLGLWLLAMFVPLVIVGIIAAIAIPQYKMYTDRAHAAEAARAAGQH